MLVALGLVLSAVFGVLAGLHGYWALGGRWGSQAIFQTKADDSSARCQGQGRPGWWPPARFGRNDTAYYSPVC